MRKRPLVVFLGGGFIGSVVVMWALSRSVVWTVVVPATGLTVSLVCLVVLEWMSRPN